MKTAEKQHVRALEERAANAWPAYVQEPLGDWRLRATFGVTKRANSVLALGAFPERTDWPAVVEEFHQRHGIPVCYYISEASPPELDGMLEAFGYQKQFACSTMIADTADILQRVEADDRFTYTCSPEADDAWIQDFLVLEEFSQERHPTYATIFSGIQPPKSFVRICALGETIGVGTVVAENGWACLSNIVIAPAHRRKGAAAQLVRSLATSASENGADNLYLQVVNDNTSAKALYHKLGFTVFSQHHYRTQP